MPDIDLDFANREEALLHLRHIGAASIRKSEIIKHNTGVYLTNIPHDPATNISTLDFKDAEDRGYFKFDFLNVGVYDTVRDENHLVDLLMSEPPWVRLWTDPNYCEQIIHIGNYYKLLGQMKPDSIPRMAMFLAMIRPAKKHLIGLGWEEVVKTVWVPPKDGGYFFKKSHSVAYAGLVVVHMNLLK